MLTQDLFKINFPGKLVFGNGVLGQLAEEITQLQSKKALVLTIEPLLNQLEDFFNALRNQGVEVIYNTGIKQEPSFQDFRNLYSQFNGQGFDTVIGIGGGSVLDVAKLLSAQLDGPQTLEEIVGNGLLKGRSKHLICAPATA
ncbi:iron-containing alcohol dehydrogenase, partial [Pseudoxanthomonas sp. SGD-10]